MPSWRRVFTRPSGLVANFVSCREGSRGFQPRELDKSATIAAQTPSLDVQIVPGCPGWDGSLEDGRLAGYERNVTVETVSKLCQQELLTEAVEALGVLVHTLCLSPKSLFYRVLKECVAKKDLPLARCTHALIVKEGYGSDTFLGNHILRMYVSHARLGEAMDVFDMVSEPDVFTWCAVIGAHVKHRQYAEAIQLYHSMRRTSVKPNGHVFVAALQACARGGDLKSGKQVHGDVLASGIEPDLFVSSCLVDMYAKCGSLEDSRRVFDSLPRKDVVTWSVIIAGYSQQGVGYEALHLYRAMQEEGFVAPDSVTFVCLLQACAGLGFPALAKGKQLHAQIREQGLLSDVVVAGSLVNMYAKCGSLRHAREVFDRLGQKSVITWNAMIAGYSQHGMGQEALSLYSTMEEDGNFAADSVTFVCLLQACASVGNSVLEKGKQLHALIRELGHETDVFVASSLVNMYVKCGSLEDAGNVFNSSGEKDVVMWTSLIAGYSRNGMGQEALCLYRDMQGKGMAAPDSPTFVSLLQACASVGTPALEMGHQLHQQIREQGYEVDVFVASSLVNMYAKCGSLEDARKVFDGLDEKDVVMWTSLLAGYAQWGMGEQALNLYSAMQREGVVAPDSVMFVSLLQACASLGILALETGKQLHERVRDERLEADGFVASSLMNMYIKCGSLEDAREVFDRLGEKCVVTWSSMIAGYSQHGLGQEALALYKAMQDEGVAALDSVTFVCLLQSCAKVAALHLGRQLHAQIKEQGLQADVLVAASLIDMYGKCGSMVDAQQVFEALPKRDVFVWNALIVGYTRQGDSDQVFDLVLRMREDGKQPDDITFLSVLTVCSHTGLVDKGREYFEAISRSSCVILTADHYTCMVDLLGRAGHLDEALALIAKMPGLPGAAVWHTLLGACQKWNNVEVGSHAFQEAIKLDQTNAAAYASMSNIYSSAQMWELAQETQRRRKRIRAWKQPGQSWWTDMSGIVHGFLVADVVKTRLCSKQLHMRTFGS